MTTHSNHTKAGKKNPSFIQKAIKAAVETPLKEKTTKLLAIQ
jgi:hypothetical protein